MVTAVFTDNSSLEFPCNDWSRGRIKHNVIYQDDTEKEVSPDVFNCINNYWAQQPQEKIDSIEELYKEIYCIMMVNTDVHEINKLLHAAIYTLMETFAWHDFALWCKLHGNLNLEIGQKDSLRENDSFETTYFTKDYENLVFFSVVLKAIIPIWGMYFNLMKATLGKDYVYIAGLELIRNPYTEANPAFQKLEEHVGIITKNSIKVTGFSVTSDIGMEEIPNYMFALTLWKKVCIFDGRAARQSIVSDVHAILKDKCRRVNTGGPNQKKIMNEQGEDISIVDTYKIVQRIPPAIEVAVTVYLSTPEFALHVEPTINLTTVKQVRKAISKELVITEFYIPILAAVCGKYIGNRNLYLIKYESILDVIAVASVALAQWGYPVISQLLITIPVPRDIYSITYSGNKTQLPITAENLNKLNTIYRHCGNINHGIKLIERIIKEINAYTFEIKQGNIENLTNELAALLIAAAEE